MGWAIKDAYNQYTGNRPAGPVINIVEDEFGQPIRTEGPHKEGDSVYIVGTATFGIVVRAKYENYLQIYWDNGIISSMFTEDSTFHNILKVVDDSPSERLKMIIKYGSN